MEEVNDPLPAYARTRWATEFSSSAISQDSFSASSSVWALHPAIWGDGGVRGLMLGRGSGARNLWVGQWMAWRVIKGSEENEEEARRRGVVVQ